MRNATVQARINPELKAEAESVLQALGINASSAISLFYTQLVRHKGIPFELKIPNAETQEAMRELKDPAYREQTPDIPMPKIYSMI